MEGEGGLEEDTWILIVDNNSLDEPTGFYSVYMMLAGLHLVRSKLG